MSKLTRNTRRDSRYDTAKAHTLAATSTRNRGKLASVVFWTLTVSALLWMAAAALGQEAAHESAQDTAAYEGDGTSLGDFEGSYSYLRALDGDATLFQGRDEERTDAEVNLPVLSGDRLWVAPRGRAEVVLSDLSVLRLDEDTEVTLESVAGEPDSTASSTVLFLRSGELQLVARDSLATVESIQVLTANATVYAEDRATLRVRTDRDWTEITVREGYAEVVTRAGSSVVRSGESAQIEGEDRIRVADADSPSSLERWGEDLELAALRQGDSYDYASSEGYGESYDDGYDRESHRDGYDDGLRYASATLSDHGRWVRIDGRRAWYPRVEAGWRPYSDGRWVTTPSGPYWVSARPWGYAPFHYGSWDRVAGYGWVWYPGRRFSPAHVVWYWGNDYVGWYPKGVYGSFYARHGYRRAGASFGFYGYGGGSWSLYSDWVFCPTRYFGGRYQRRYQSYGHDVRHRTGWRELPRGLVTTDARRVPRKYQNRTAVLWNEAGGQSRVGHRGQQDQNLPDMTPVLARNPKLPPQLEREIQQPRRGRKGPTQADLGPGRGAGGNGTSADRNQDVLAREREVRERFNRGDRGSSNTHIDRRIERRAPVLHQSERTRGVDETTQRSQGRNDAGRQSELRRDAERREEARRGLEAQRRQEAERRQPAPQSTSRVLRSPSPTGQRPTASNRDQHRRETERAEAARREAARQEAARRSSGSRQSPPRATANRGSSNSGQAQSRDARRPAAPRGTVQRGTVQRNSGTRSTPNRSTPPRSTTNRGSDSRGQRSPATTRSTSSSRPSQGRASANRGTSSRSSSKATGGSSNRSSSKGSSRSSASSSSQRSSPKASSGSKRSGGSGKSSQGSQRRNSRGGGRG